MKGFWQLLRRFVPPYKRYLALNILFNLLSALLTIFSFALIIPILEMLFQVREGVYTFIPWGEAPLREAAVNNFYWLTQQAIAQYGQSVTLALLAVALVLMTALKTGTAYLSSWFIIPLRNGIVRDIRRQMYAKVLTLPLGFFTNERKGDVMARITGDVTEVETSIMASLEMMFKNPVMIIVCLATMIVISWQLTIFVLLLLPLAGTLMGRVGKHLKRSSLEAQNQWGTLMSIIEETLSGLRIIKAFNAEGRMDSRFGDATGTFFRMQNRVARRQTLAHPMSEFLGTLTIAVVLWFGGSLILGGRSSITAPSFIYYMVIFYSIINPAKDLAKASYAIQKGLASMLRIDKILGAQNPIADPSHPATLPVRGGDIEYRDVTFRYSADGPMVIDGITLRIPAGKTVALVGASGSGKTTLADLIPRFWDVATGSVTIAGTDIRQVRVHDLRALMGIVNQEAILFNDTIYNNIAFGVEHATPERVEAAARIANAHDFIMATPDGYNTMVGDRGSRLSGGQRQRLSIARAVLKDPAILILDEATSALDSESEHLVQQALERLMQGRTTLVIAHRLATVRSADTICVIDNGRILEQGTHDELLALGGAYRHLVDMQRLAQ